MDNNEIYHIPQLKLLGTSPMKAAAKNQDDRVKDRQEDGGNEDGSGHDSSHVIKGVNNDVMLLPTTSDHGLTREPVTVKSEGTPSSTNLGQVTSDDGERNTTMAPFPNLETLSLAHNLVGGVLIPKHNPAAHICSFCRMRAWWPVLSGLC